MLEIICTGGIFLSIYILKNLLDQDKKYYVNNNVGEKSARAIKEAREKQAERVEKRIGKG